MKSKSTGYINRVQKVYFAGFLLFFICFTLSSCDEPDNNDLPNSAAPVITISQQPAALTNVTAGNISGSKMVTATVTENASLSYQWYSNTVNSNEGGAPLAGRTNAQKDISADLTVGTHYFFCEVSTVCGTANSVRSNVAAVVVSANNAAGASITLIIEQIVNHAPMNYDITLSRTGTGYPAAYTVNINNPSDYESILWEIAGVGAYSDQTITGTASSFDLEAANIRYNSLGGHLLRLTVFRNGNKYQRDFPFTIVQ